MDDKYVSKLSPTVDFWAGMYLVIIAILSILGNASVLVSAGHRLTLLKAPELLTVNLAITDIGMALSMYPLSISSAFNHAWIGGDTSCLYYGVMGMIFSITSIMTLAVMGMVRPTFWYEWHQPIILLDAQVCAMCCCDLGGVHVSSFVSLCNLRLPTTSFSSIRSSCPICNEDKSIKFQRRTIRIAISGIWLYASLWALFPLLGWGSYGPEPFGLACSIDWTGYGESLNHSTFIMTMSVLCTFIPCLVILFTYFGIAWKLHRAYQSIQSNGFQYGKIEKKITLVAVMISSGFFIAWTPYVAASFWSMFHSQEQGHMAPFVTLLPCLFAKSSTVYNPFIYFIFQRNSWHKLLCSQRPMFCCSHHASSPAKGGKLEGKSTIFGNRTDETSVDLMRSSGRQSGSEMMPLG